MNQKYEMTDDAKIVHGRRLHRIKALRDFDPEIKALGDFGHVKAGELGGWIQSDKNLSHEGTAWVFGNACVMDLALVEDDACVCDSAMISEAARISGIANVKDYAIVTNCATISDWVTIRDRAFVGGNAKIEGGVCVYGGASVYEDAHISGDARLFGDAYVYGKTRIFGYALVGGRACVESAEIHGCATLLDASRLIGCDSIEIYKPSHCFTITVGRIAYPMCEMTFARMKDGNIYMSYIIAPSDIRYKGTIEEHLLNPLIAEPSTQNIIQSAIEFAKNHIADTIYTA